MPLHNKEASTIARAFFERWICRFGVPTAIVSDRGKEFLNAVMQDLTKWLGANYDKTSPYHPQTNASAERYNHEGMPDSDVGQRPDLGLGRVAAGTHVQLRITPRSTSPPWSHPSSSPTSTTPSSHSSI